MIDGVNTRVRHTLLRITQPLPNMSRYVLAIIKLDLEFFHPEVFIVD